MKYVYLAVGWAEEINLSQLAEIWSLVGRAVGSAIAGQNRSENLLGKGLRHKAGKKQKFLFNVPEAFQGDPSASSKRHWSYYF